MGCGVRVEGSSHPALPPASLVLEDEGVIGVRVPVSGSRSEDSQRFMLLQNYKIQMD